MNRRSFLKGTGIVLAGAVAAPMLIRIPGLLMPVRSPRLAKAKSGEPVGIPEYVEFNGSNWVVTGSTVMVRETKDGQGIIVAQCSAVKIAPYGEVHRAIARKQLDNDPAVTIMAHLEWSDVRPDYGFGFGPDTLSFSAGMEHGQLEFRMPL